MAKSKELALFEKIYAELDENHRIFAKKLYTELIFISSNLNELKKEINENGAIMKTVNGNGFEVLMENPAQKAYNNMIKNYNATVKQLAELAPVKKTGKSKLDMMRDDE